MANLVVLLLQIAGFISLLLPFYTHAASFTLKNKCATTIWPAALGDARSPALFSTGIELPPGATFIAEAPRGWSGRMWARTSCSTSANGNFKCKTGDCGSNTVACKGAGGELPVTLVEFTLNGDGNKDFYDVSLVDGFNLPVSVIPSVSSCQGTSCVKDVNSVCPPELQLLDGSAVVACKSACLAFGSPKYCCTGSFNSPDVCKPTEYSTLFKINCPEAYSYAYDDDATSTFTCVESSYDTVFCP